MTVFQPEFIRIDIYDLRGRNVEALSHEIYSSGQHEVKWHARGVPGGVYFVRFQAGPIIEIQKVVLIK